MDEKQMCAYGCGQEAKFQLKNGKWCCSQHHIRCPKLYIKCLGTNKGVKHVRHSTIKSDICAYGCGQKPKFQLKNGKWCCSDSFKHCLGFRKKVGIGLTGRKQSEEEKEKRAASHRGKIVSLETGRKISEAKSGKPFTDEHKKKLSIARKGKKIEEIIGEEKGARFRHRMRKTMIDGRWIVMLKAMKKISKQEIMLRNIVKELYPNCEFQYPVLNYSLDIALVDKKIAIEYDGYYHFDTEEHILYHKLRQEKIENEGWTFLRYNKSKNFSTIEKIKEDIENVINLKEVNYDTTKTCCEVN